MKADERAVGILLRNLETAGLMHKRGAAYSVGKLGRACLNRNSPDYHGAYLDLLKHQWEQWAQLPTVIQTGTPIEHNGPDDPALFLQNNLNTTRDATSCVFEIRLILFC